MCSIIYGYMTVWVEEADMTPAIMEVLIINLISTCIVCITK